MIFSLSASGPFSSKRDRSPARRNLGLSMASIFILKRAGLSRRSTSAISASLDRKGAAPQVTILSTSTSFARTSGDGIIWPVSYLPMACLVTMPPSFPARSSMLNPAIFRAARRRCPKGVSGMFRVRWRSIIIPCRFT